MKIRIQENSRRLRAGAGWRGRCGPYRYSAGGTPRGSGRGDALTPVMFWTMNQYNEFVGNKAASVQGYGSCFWLLSSALSGPSQNLHWTTGSDTPEDYAKFNTNTQAPLLRFRDNSCSTSMYGLIADGSVFPNDVPVGLTPVPNPYLADGNIFLNIEPFTCNPSVANNCGIYQLTNQPGSTTTAMNVANAAIGWKQPNGFYYPPNFGFRRNAFDSTSQRHYVIDQFEA